MEDAEKRQQVLAAIGKNPRPISKLPTSFTMPIVSISDDKATAEIRLCTGRTMHIPTSSVKSIIPMGHLTSEDNHYDLVYGEIDITTEAGRLLQQAAHEIVHLFRATRRAAGLQAGAVSRQEILIRPAGLVTPRDYPLPATSTKWAFSGIAGVPQQLVYTAPPNQFLLQTSATCTGCFLLEFNTSTGFFDNNLYQYVYTGFTYYADAAHGTPLGNSYTATVVMNFQLWQETT